MKRQTTAVLFVIGFFFGRWTGLEETPEPVPEEPTVIEEAEDCRATALFRTPSDEALVLIVCPDSLGPRPAGPEQRRK